jgi:hypothetical protein
MLLNRNAAAQLSQGEPCRLVCASKGYNKGRKDRQGGGARRGGRAGRVPLQGGAQQVVGLSLLCLVRCTAT